LRRIVELVEFSHRIALNAVALLFDLKVVGVVKVLYILSKLMDDAVPVPVPLLNTIV
jgi:hypothetical protein